MDSQIEYAGSGIRVNAVSLGVIKTPAHDPAGRVRRSTRSGGWADRRRRRRNSVSERATFVTGETLHIEEDGSLDTDTRGHTASMNAPPRPAQHRCRRGDRGART
jgi:NAD(P)-dependent dehydrogenase (short-subunit alcohol dehydrogenase family)